MLKKILIGLAVVLLVLIVVIAMQPSDFRISRSAAIPAPPATVFAEVNELKNWEGWSPWAKMDPSMKQTYEGPAAGTGAISHWAGNSQVGEGQMTITESKPDELVRIKLDFIKPMAATNDVQFDFKPQGTETLVTWTMSGKSNFVGKAFGLFMDMEKMLGGQFEQGLAQLKTAATAKAAQ
ncbi:SRPBCC family protein [Luteolibacter luteus]|uniref:SRPBCC family protein n=1 Tax=Luteolibacter luteus TaxID=2728835 RepID=A0A858RJM6_9BACT|nr:SRPBCC family protein [Luteolibacter luteus]QJE96410.1 SRPBCC family protein [Luteolibacter luteus]